MATIHATAHAVTDVCFADIVAARQRIAGGVLVTPCVESPALSAITGAQVFCKLEYQQRAGSFKERGACNALLLLSAEERARGVIAASAGNHALALALHGKRLGIPVTVVMPTHAPLVKQRRCRELGARFLNHGDNIAEARSRADLFRQGGGPTRPVGEHAAAPADGEAGGSGAAADRAGFWGNRDIHRLPRAAQ